MTRFVYLLSGVLLVLLGIALFTWGYSNSTFPEIQNTENVVGMVSDVELHDWKINFKVGQDLRKFSYLRHYGNFEVLKNLMASNDKQTSIEMIVEKTNVQTSPIIYEIVVNGVKVTSFEEKMFTHRGYTKSIYWFAIGLLFIGVVGIIMGTRKGL